MPSRSSSLLSAVVMMVSIVLIAFFATVAVREHKPWIWLFVLSLLILIGGRIQQARKQVEAHSR